MIGKAIVDSGVFIGSQYAKNQYAKGAIGVLENLKDSKISKIYTTNFVLAETINFLMAKAGYQKANAAFRYLTETDGIEIINIDNFPRMKEIFQKYQTLSVTDCSLVVLSEKLKIKELFSFDRHFDSVKGIIRLV